MRGGRGAHIISGIAVFASNGKPFVHEAHAVRFCVAAETSLSAGRPLETRGEGCREDDLDLAVRSMGDAAESVPTCAS